MAKSCVYRHRPHDFGGEVDGVSGTARLVTKVVDEIDLKIIEALRADGRTPNKTLAIELGVSETTIASRIRGLRERKVMLVTLQRDIFAQGYEFQCIAEVYVANRKVDAVAADLCKLDLSSVALTLGSPEITVVFSARDRADMMRVIGEQIAQVRGVERVETHVVLDVRKYESSYGDLSHL
jgi:DNA-binding Lrp family transcriptional regulator